MVPLTASRISGQRRLAMTHLMGRNYQRVSRRHYTVTSSAGWASRAPDTERLARPCDNILLTLPPGGPMAATVPEFTHLHVHSEYSMLDGLSRVPEMVAFFFKQKTAYEITR